MRALLRGPRSAWLLWIVGLLLGLAVFPIILHHSQLYYAEGGTSPDGPGMLLVSAFFTAPIWLGAWMIFILVNLLGFAGGGSLTDFRAQSWLGWLLITLSIAVSGFFLLQITRVEYWRVSRLPFTLWLLACAIFPQYLRAAAVIRSRTPPDAGADE